MKNLLKFSAIFAAFPAVSFAAVGLLDIIGTVLKIFNVIIPLLITLGVIYFIWGVIKYINSKDEEAQKEARDFMIKGIIGLFVIVSIWGLVNLVGKTFGLGAGSGTTSTISLPAVPCPGGQVDPLTGQCI